MYKFNVTSILLFVQSLPQTIQSQAMKSLPQAIHSLPQMFQTLSPCIPLEVKFGISLALIIVSYISHRSYLQAKVTMLENTVAELNKAVAILENQHEHLKNTVSYNEQHIETQHEHLKNTVSYNERLVGETTDKVNFIFTNMTYLQKALYKKLDLEEKYREGKKEGVTKNRQQAVQEYMIAEKTVARRFNEV
jgi:hypothetical protein